MSNIERNTIKLAQLNQAVGICGGTPVSNDLPALTVPNRALMHAFDDNSGDEEWTEIDMTEVVPPVADVEAQIVADVEEQIVAEGEATVVAEVVAPVVNAVEDNVFCQIIDSTVHENENGMCYIFLSFF